MSLWSVDDDATAALMADLVASTATMPPAVALRDAMRRARERDPDPTKWAAFALFGGGVLSRDPGVGDRAQLVLEEVHSRRLVTGGGRIRAHRAYRLRLESGRSLHGAAAAFHLRPDGSCIVLQARREGFELEACLGPPFGVETLALVAADRFRPAEGRADPDPTSSWHGVQPLRTFAALASAVDWERGCPFLGSLTVASVPGG